MGDRLVQTFYSVGLFLQVPLAGNCKLATLLQKKKTMYKTQIRVYNGFSLRLLERQITLHLLWCNKMVVMLGLKLGVRMVVNLEVKM